MRWGPAAWRAPFVLLEDRLGGAPALLFRQPVEIVTCTEAAGLAASFTRLEDLRGAGWHLAGFAAYEVGAALEPRAGAVRAGEGPLLWFGAFAAPEPVDQDTLDAAFAALPPPAPLAALRVEMTEAEYRAAFAQVQAYLWAGDIYQANLTFGVSFRATEWLSLYAALRARQPAGHAALVQTGGLCLASVSPELWVETRGGAARLRPMKGTVKRAAEAASDWAAAAALRADPKQLAENLMIVDLLRNDLSRVAALGSVRVTSLFDVETYPSLHTMTSTIEGEVPPGLALIDLFRALFPCGSVVGAPKIRAAEILATLEKRPRGVYTGTIGHAAPGGDVRFNVAIRTAAIGADGVGRFGCGGGVVADSDAGSEYAEALLKAEVLTGLAEDYCLIETFGWRDRVLVRLPLHLDRLCGSAALLGFAVDRGAVAARLRMECRQWPGRDLRVRLMLARDGTLSVETAPAPPAPAAPWRVGIARVRLDRADPFLRHKTTRRGPYDAAAAEAAAAGWDDAVLLNRQGEVADSTRATVFVPAEGRLRTPPLEAGVLPGVLRAGLLADRLAEEGVLRPEALAGQAFWLGNSLRGLCSAVLI